MGAWIETCGYLSLTLDMIVASHVGAWIETLRKAEAEAYAESHPMWVRGLKQGYGWKESMVTMSHPMWVRGLKPCQVVILPPAGRRIPCGCVD